MAILYDYQTFALQSRGGISRYFAELIPRVARNADVDVFMGLHINDYGLERSRKQFDRFFGLRVPELRHTLGLRLSFNAFLLRKFAARLTGGIYHQTYFYNHVPDWKGRRVVTVYDMIYELFPHEYDADDPTARNKAIAVKNADRVICISEYTRRQLIEILGVPESKTSVVYLGNSLTREVHEPALYGFPYLLYVGKRGGYKNFNLLLTAFARSSVRNSLKVVCFGGPAFTIEENALITSLGLTEKVIPCSGGDTMLSNLYTYASALVYPSTCEGFGIPPLEAMHFGCPAVVSNASSIPEVAGDAGIYFDPSSADDIAQKIELAVSDETVRAEVITRGKTRAALFTWDRCARETLDVYGALA